MHLGYHHALAALYLASSVLAQAPMPADASTTTAPLAARISASVTRGVAPLAVFFDGLASEVRVGTPHDARYAWTFFDAGTSRPRELGFCAAHVFESPGQHDVELEVTDRAGNVGRATARIEVLPYSGRTIWVSETLGNDAGDGRSEAAPVRTLDRAMLLLRAELSAGGPSTAVRVLFRRGENFSTTVGWGMPAGTFEGPIHFGAYGSGAQPILRQLANGPLVYGHDKVSGLRVVDLDLRGSYDITTGLGGTNQQLVNITGGARHLVHRCSVRGADYGIALAGDPRTRRSEVTISECWIEDVRSYAAYLGAERLAVIGCHMARAGDMHILRVWYARRAVIVGNELLDPSLRSARGLHALKLHAHAGGSQGGDPIATEWVWVGENVLRGSTWPATIAPQNRALDERIANVVFERNVILPDEYSTSPPTNQSLLVVARDVTVRGNVFVGTNRSPDLRAVVVDTYPLVPAPERVRLHDNTMVQFADRPGSVALFAAIEGTQAKGVQIEGNLVYSPLAGSPPTALFAVATNFPLYELSEHENLVHAPLSPVWAWLGYQPIGLQAWKALDSGHGRSDLAADPLFLAPQRFDLRLHAASPARLVGRTLGAPADVIERAKLARARLLR